MSLPASWVEALFSRLTVRYGSAFQRQYADIDAGAIKADWGNVLARVTPESIRYALENLPDSPPNAQQFRAICNRAPAPELPRLEAPAPDPQRVAELLSGVGKIKTRQGMSEAEWCAYRLREIAKTRPLTGSQRDMLKACEQHTQGPAQLTGEFTPVPAHCLPVGMR